MVAIFTGAGTGFERGSGSVLGNKGLLGSSAQGRDGEQVSVNAATGNLLISRRDEFLTGVGLNAYAARTYNSLGDLSDDNADNWRLSTDRRVYGLAGTANSAGSTVHRVSADGTDIVYSWDATRSAYVAKDGPGAYDTLIYAAGSWTWTNGDTQGSETYTANGSQWLISRETNSDGYFLSYSYANGHIYRVTTPDGSYVQYDWSGNNVSDIVTGYTDLSSNSAATLTRTRYTYDAQNRLQTVTVDLSPNDNSIADGKAYTTTYTYVGTSTLVASISQSDGSRIDVTYDANNRVSTIAQTVATGVTSTSTLTYGSGYTTVTDALGQVTRLDYDSGGNLTKITMPAASSGASPQVTRFAYDASGNVMSVTDALGNSTSYTYDSNGNALTVTDRLGNVTTRTYGSRNELLTETTTGSDSGSASASHTARYVYDAENHLRYAISAEGDVTEYRYSPSGKVQYRIEYSQQLFDTSTLASNQAPSESAVNAWRDAIGDKSSSQVTFNAYDARDNLWTTRNYAVTNADGTASAAESVVYTYFTYDQAGQLLSRNNYLKNAETFVYDGLGRIVSAVDVNGGATSYVFDDANSKTVVTLASGLVQTSTYNLAGELVSYAEAGAATSLAAVTGTATYGYDQVGRMRWEIDATGIKTYHLYDNAGRKVADVSGAGEMTEYKYDADDRIAATVRYATPLTPAQLTSLDDQNTAADIASFRPAASSSDAWNWTAFDKEGRVIESIAGDGSATVYGYDSAGRLIQSTDCATKFSATTLAQFKASPPLQTTTYTTTTTSTDTYHAPPPPPSESANKLPDLSSMTQWYPGTIITRTSTAAISGQPAFLYQCAAGTARTTAVQGRGVTVPANTTVTWTISLMATSASAASHFIQMAPDIGTPSTRGVGSATIASGPGSLTLDSTTGAWTITGLSTTQATTITLTHTFGQSSGVFFDVGLSRNSTAGDEIILSNPVVTTCAEIPAAYLPPSTNLLPDLSSTTQWSETNLSQTASAAINGQPAYKYAAAASGTAALIDGQVSVQAGDTLSWTVTVQASGVPINLRLGISADGGASALGTMTRTGFGIMTQTGSGYWLVQGLSTSAPTTLQMTHSFTSAATVDLRLLLDSSSATVQAGHAIIVSNPVVTDTPGTALAGYTTTTTTTTSTPSGTTFPQPASSAGDVIARNFYDQDGLLLGTLDGAGFLTQHIYDDSGQKTDDIAYANAATVTTGTFDDVLASITADSANDRHTRYVYNNERQLRFVIDDSNHVTQTGYDYSDEAISVTRFANALASTTTDFSYANMKTLVAAAGFASANDRTSWSVYDNAGRVAYTIDAAGGVSGFAYNSSGQVVKQTQFATVRVTSSLPTQATMDSWAAANSNSSADRITRNYYDGAGVLRYIVDGEGYVTLRTEDAEGRLTAAARFANALSLTDADTINSVQSAVVASAGAAVTTSTTYDVQGRVLTTSDGEGSVTRFAYNANGTLQSKTVADGTADASTTYYVYDAAGRVLEEHRAYGAAEESVTSYGYDSFGNVVTITDPFGHSTTRTFDKLGQLLTSKDALGGTTSYVYDGFGQIVKTTDALGNITYNYYDDLGRLTQSCDALKYVTRTSYTAFGEIASVTRFYNAATNSPSATVPPTVTANAALDATTSFAYDKLGRVTKVTDAESKSETYTLDAFGNRVTVVNKLGGTTTNSYDARGLLLSETLPMASVNSAGTQVAATVTNTFSYDARGNRTKMVEAAGLAEQRTTTYAYDKCDRLVTKKGDAVTRVAYSDFTSNSAVTVTTTAGVVPTESYAYDKRGNLIQVTDANGAKTFSYYDDLDRKIAELKGVTATTGTLTTSTYDAAGNKLFETVYGDFVALPGSPGGSAPSPVDAGNYRQTHYYYDVLNRLTATAVDNVLVGTWSQANSGVSTATRSVNSNLSYDANGNVIVSSDENGFSVRSWYDALGRKKAQLDEAGYLTSWTYDDEGNVLSERRYATKWTGSVSTSAPPAVATSGSDRVTNFTYDQNGHRLTETRTGVTAWTVNSSNGALTAASTSATVTYSYNALGEVTKQTEATGDAVTYNYDANGRLIKESRAAYLDQTGVSVTPTVSYSYNGLNNLTRTQQGGAALNNATDRITTYVYGAGGRLASMTDPAGRTHNYDYDAAGNQVRDSYTRTLSDGSSVTEGILYRRDLLGRIVTQTIATKNTASSWTRGDSQNTQYDVYGQVSKRGVNGLWQESFTYNNRGLVEKTNTGDGVWRFFVYDAKGNQVLAIESEGNDYSSTSLGTSTTAGTLLYSLGTYAGSTFMDGVNTSVSFYDARGQVTLVYQLQRVLTAGGAKTTIGAWKNYNAFGELANESDALGYTTTYSYNTMGRLIQKVMPQVWDIHADGTNALVNPTETYYYDLAGRQVATKDADSHTISQTLLAGIGYGGTDAEILKEFHPDGGVKQTQYDVFGDATTLTDELARNDTRTYDGMGRLLTDTHASGLVDHYSYDLLGQRITHWDSAHGSAVVETTDYDLQGRVTSTVDLAGDRTTYTYSWSGAVSTALGTNGGWTKTTTQWAQLGASALSKSETTDVHGLTTSTNDFADNSISFTYDRAGRLTQKTGTNSSTSGLQEVTTTLAYTYFNTGLVATVVDSSTETSGNDFNTITSTFGYDARGLRTAEKYTGNPVYQSYSDGSYNTLVSTAQTLEDATITYDALGRLSNFSNKNAAGTVDATVYQGYDAAGNIRETTTTNPNLVSGGSTTTDNWFTYDAMNRMVIANGYEGAGGTSISYDAAGNRKTATTAGVTQTYYYDADNQVTDVYQGASRIAHTTRNSLGRVTAYSEYQGSTVTQNRYNIVYNARGQITSEHIDQVLYGATDLDTDVTNGYDVYGNLTSTYNYNNGTKDTFQNWTYAWLDQAVVKNSSFDKDYWSSSNNNYTSNQNYDGLGRLQRAFIADGTPRAVNFALTSDGNILTRTVNNVSSDDPKDVHLYVNGVQVLEYTNDNKSQVQNYDYAAMISDNTAPGSSSSRFYKGGYATPGVEGGTSGYDPVNAITAGTTQNNRKSYTVQAGDTLQGIAQSLWGDSSLWYLIADANGLSAGAALAAGEQLAIPLKGPSSSNNADMYRPYDPQASVGDLSPTHAKPAKGNKCGAFGQILLTAIAVAVTAFTYGTLGPVGAAIAGNLASQGVGVATGIQSQFSFQSLAMTALTAGVTQGLTDTGAFGELGIAGNDAVSAGARAVVSNGISQGVAIATGLQDKFDWAGVAAAGIGAGAGRAVGNFAARQLHLNIAQNANGTFQDSASGAAFRGIGGMASAVANAATRSVINGSDFGDNILAALPDVLGQTIGQTIGGIIADGVSGRTTGAPAAGTGEEQATAGADGSTSTPMGGGLLLGMAGVSAAPFDPQLFEAERFGQEMENFLNSLPPDPLAPLPSSSHVDVNVADLLASSTEVSFQGTPIYEGDILVVGTRSRSELGSLSARYETGGRGVATVSTGRGRGGKPDLGGVSYGSYQLTSQTAVKIKGKTVIVHDGGNVAIFLKSEGAPWSADFAGLEPGSKAFSDVWKGIAASDPEDLHAAEHEFIKRTHYDPAVERILSSTGLDIGELDPAVQDVLWSTAVQHGAGSASKGATLIFVDAINKTDYMTTRASSSYSASLVTNVYARRTSYWPSDYARYQSEQSAALKMLGGN